MRTSPAPADLLPTYVVELTPRGRAAVAVVLVAGPDAVRAVGACFRANSGRSLADVPVNRIVVGCWGGPGGEELVVCRRGEDEIEVHCHGGSAAVRAVMDALIAHGCLQTTWQDWLRYNSRVSPKLGFESRRDSSTWASFSETGNLESRPATSSVESRDSTTCEAQIALADAVTMRTAAILVDQLNGALSRAVHSILAAIAAADWQRAAQLSDELWGRRELGLHLTSPWRVVFAGPPNVGKSSLMNALAGFQRAIVSPEPGTTRDVVTLATAIDGWPVELADTAGLRPARDEVESAGVALAEGALASADLAVIVEDATQDGPRNAGELPPLPSRVLLVRNKIDLVLDLVESDAGEDSPTPDTHCNTSALTGRGIVELAAAIGASLVPNPPPSGAAVPFTARQVESLAVARNAIGRQHASAASDALQALLAED
jgi:tRNA modification GTPase